MVRLRASVADDLQPGQMVAIDGAALPLAVARVGDAWFAFENNCTHEDFPLTEGMVDGEEVECALHGARFCLRSGAARAAPASCGIRTFPVCVEDGAVFVELP